MESACHPTLLLIGVEKGFPLPIVVSPSGWVKRAVAQSWLEHAVRLSEWPPAAIQVAVGMSVTQHPPHGSLRAELPHKALASGHNAKRSGG